MKRRIVTIEEIREKSDVYYMSDCDDTLGVMALVEVENMGFCRDGVTRWYHFHLDGEPVVYYKR